MSAQRQRHLEARRDLIQEDDRPRKKKLSDTTLTLRRLQSLARVPLERTPASSPAIEIELLHPGTHPHPARCPPPARITTKCPVGASYWSAVATTPGARILSTLLHPGLPKRQLVVSSRQGKLLLLVCLSNLNHTFFPFFLGVLSTHPSIQFAAAFVVRQNHQPNNNNHHRPSSPPSDLVVVVVVRRRPTCATYSPASSSSTRSLCYSTPPPSSQLCSLSFPPFPSPSAGTSSSRKGSKATHPPPLNTNRDGFTTAERCVARGDAGAHSAGQARGRDLEGQDQAQEG